MKLRKVYLINPKLQLSIIAVAVGISILCFLVLQFFFQKYWADTMAGLQMAGIAQNHPVARYMSLQMSKMQGLLFGIGIVSLVVNVLALTWLSHKIAGPIYRIECCMRDILNGTQERPVQVRKHDFFKSTAALLEQIRQRGLK